MKFKKLEVAGFKSFGDRLEIKFGAGVTGIVGPNGCGKSNVADSIRWVLGEQSAKLLRGSSMQDVIFNGTENRKSLSYCEVNLYFDNTEKLFPSLDYDEVVISRKLYRSGESEYCLNKTPCRLKDITELLRDGGMGREGYSIIGQGRIDELLSAKPEDRRAIFEEAAGISKFKAKKLETERKLARTRDNMAKIDLIMEEKSKQLEPLTRQAEAARKWLDLRETLKLLEINTYIYQFDSASQAKDAINARLNGVLEQIDLRQKDCDKANADYNDAMREVSGADRTIETLREELLTLTVGLEKQAGQVKLLNERMGYLTSQNERIRQDNEKLNGDYEATMSFIEQGNAEIEKRSEEIERQKELCEKYNAEYLEVVGTLTESEGEVDSNHKAMVEAMEKLTDIRANMSRMVAEREALNASTAALRSRIEAIVSRAQTDLDRADALKADLGDAVEKKNAIGREIERLYAINNACVSEVGEKATEIDSVSAKFYTEKSRHKMLTEMQNTYEGFAYSVKKLIADSKKDKALSDRIEGLAAQLITVKEGFETAIEMALGGAVQNVVVETEDDAKYLIDYLKTSRYGRVTFLPISSVKPRALDSEYRALLSQPGCLGIADELIEFDGKYKNIFSSLLGGTVVTDNMDTAIALARKSRYGFKIVTLEGDIINPHGSITGGSKKSELTNVFGYDKEISATAETLRRLQERLDTLGREREDAAERQRQSSEKVRQKRDELHKLDVDVAAKSEAYNKLIAECADASAQKDALQAELDKGVGRIDSITQDIDSVGALESMVQSAKEQAGSSGEEQRQAFDALRRKRDEKHENMTSARVRLSTLENEYGNIVGEVKRLQANVQSITQKIEYNNAQTAENNALIAAIDAEMNGLTEAAGEQDSGKVTEIRTKLANLDEFKQSKQLSLAAHDTRRMELMNELTELGEKKNREEMQLLKVDTDIEQMQQRVEEEYHLVYDECLPFKQEGYDLSRGIADAARIKRQMNNLGNVNVGAIEQCKEVFDSYHEMELQREDLIKAENDLVKIIKELSAEMLERFTGQFEQIRTNFIKIFKELFDGGDADLVLLESENPLEAGIEIVAQPPQKKLQSISLLSGGERALTAIAILFAILRLKPMPFCVLDEIEAALDDANAGRFAKYLRRFSEETQFIVITHRKPTMELADSLYGVTMEEKGVSKIVSVKLSEAIAFEGQNAG